MKGSKESHVCRDTWLVHAVANNNIISMSVQKLCVRVGADAFQGALELTSENHS